MGALLSFLFRLWATIQVRIWRLLVPTKLRRGGVQLGESVTFYGWPIVQMAESSEIRIGERVVVCSDSRFTALGVAKPVILRTLQPGARIMIGADTGMSGTVVCAARSVSIGASCLIGADVSITDTDFHAMEPVGRRYRHGWDGIGIAGVTIGDNVFIGAGSRILKGVSIGDNTVIGAGSVVVASIPANVIAAGVPCRVISELPVGSQKATVGHA